MGDDGAPARRGSDNRARMQRDRARAEGVRDAFGASGGKIPGKARRGHRVPRAQKERISAQPPRDGRDRDGGGGCGGGRRASADAHGARMAEGAGRLRRAMLVLHRAAAARQERQRAVRRRPGKGEAVRGRGIPRNRRHRLQPRAIFVRRAGRRRACGGAGRNQRVQVPFRLGGTVARRGAARRCHGLGKERVPFPAPVDPERVQQHTCGDAPPVPFSRRVFADRRRAQGDA